MPLGRGLSSLIPNLKQPSAVAPVRPRLDENETAALPSGSVSHERVWQIPTSLIKANDYQPRQNFNHQDLEELVNSIKEYGVLQPLLVTEAPDGNYELIAGERRWRAAQIAGLATVPALVKEIKGAQKLAWALIENIQRQNLNLLEEAFAYERLMKEFKLTQEDVAKKVGKSRPYVGNALRLLGLPEEIKEGLLNNTINATTARAILGLTDSQEQIKMYRRLVNQPSKVRQVEDDVAAVRIKKSGESRRDPIVLDYECQLRDALGTKVRITQRGGKGSIVVDYYSDEELRRIMKALT